MYDATRFTFVRFLKNGTSHSFENFKPGTWVAESVETTMSGYINNYTFLRKQLKLARLNEIKFRDPLLLLVSACHESLVFLARVRAIVILSDEFSKTFFKTYFATCQVQFE